MVTRLQRQATVMLRLPEVSNEKEEFYDEARHV